MCPAFEVFIELFVAGEGIHGPDNVCIAIDLL